MLSTNFNKQIIAIFWMVAAGIFFSVLSALFVKIGSIPSQQSFFLLISAACFQVLLIKKAKRVSDFTLNKPVLYIFRAIFATIGMNLWFYVIKQMPLNEATAISYTTPLFVSLLAILFLKEPIIWYRLIALIIGFAGCIVVIRPKVGDVNIYPFLAILSALFWASSDLLLKIQTRTENIYKQSFYLTLFMSILSLLFAIPVWIEVSFADICWIILLGNLYLLSVFSIYNSYKNGFLTIVAPFDFLRLIFTAIISYLFFGETIDKWTILGSLIILASSIFLISSSRKRDIFSE